jgi:hypothetical protein
MCILINNIQFTNNLGGDMTRFLRLVPVWILILLLGMSISQGQEVRYSAGPATGAQNLQGLGFSWADFNNDGFIDLFVEPDNLIINHAGTSFTRAASSGVPFQVNMVGSACADFNGDGYADVLTTQGSATPILYTYNSGTGMFEAAANVGDLATVTSGTGSQMFGVSAGDYNGDGYVDIVWAGGAGSGDAGKVRLLMGGPSGFTSVGGAATVTPVIDTTFRFESWNACFIDANNDGYPDLFLPSIRNGLAAGTTPGSALYINDGDGTFSQPVPDSTGLVVDDTVRHWSAIASAWADFDNDGNLDLAISSLGGEQPGFGLLKGNGNGTFTNVAATAGITYNSGARGLTWGDYNNDGYIDLMEGAGWRPPRMWRNNGNGTFTDVTSILGIPSSGYNSRSAGFVDYNSDGFLDYYCLAGGGDALWTNGGNLNNWIGFRAIADGNNGLGTTARFTLYTNGGSTTQIRTIEAGGSGGSTGGNVWAHFGIGIAEEIDQVVVTWPDGSEQSFDNLAINQYWIIKQGSVIPDAPELVNPSNGATDQDVYTTLDWNAADGALEYRVVVSLDETFSNPSKVVADVTLTDISTMVELGLGGQYYWHVYAMNAGFSSVSDVYTFSTTMIAPTEVPILLSPASGAVDQAGAMTLVVGKTSDAAEYRWQVSTLPSFSSFFINELTVDTTNPVDLVAGWKYYWRVRGENNSGVSDFSNPDSFTVMSAPAVPGLVSPANNAQNVRRDTLSLTWRSVALASNYAIEVSRSSAGGLVVNTYTTVDTTLRLTSLLNQTTYYWRVRANNIGGSSLFSGAYSFVTIIGAPAAPALVSPAASAVDVPLSPVLTWTSVVNATKYHVQVATANTFDSASTVFNTIVYEDTVVTVIPALDTDTPYFWRVSAMNLGGEGVWATPRTFITGTGVGVEVPDGLPTVFALMQNYPNPFNPSTTIRYDVPENAHVRITIYNLLGQEVAVLVDEVQAANKYSIEWHATDISTGVYFYRMVAQSQSGSGKFTDVKSFMLIR